MATEYAKKFIWEIRLEAARVETEARIREAHLIVARPEQVLAELEKYSVEIKDSVFGGDEDLERSLLARNEPLIDLGLARYGREKEVLATLYRKSRATPTDPLQERYLLGLRVACLSNEVGGYIFSQFPEDVFGKEEFARLITEGDYLDLSVLLANRNLGDKILEALYKNEGLFASLPDERRLDLVSLSSANPRLIDSGGASDLDARIHEAILTMLASAPTTVHWFRTLRQLLHRLDPGNLHTPDEPITPILERWMQVPVSEKYTPKDDFSALSMRDRDEFRCLIAAMYGRHRCGKDGKSSILGNPDSPDVVLRCAYYGKAQLTENEMKGAYARDEDTYLLAVLCNDSVYYSPALRKLLEEQLSENLMYDYQRRCAQIQKRRPSFDPRPVSDWLIEDTLPESKELTILKQLETTVASVTITFKSFQTWIFWGFLVIGALVLFVLLKGY